MHAFKKSGYGRILVGAEPTFISTASYGVHTHLVGWKHFSIKLQLSPGLNAFRA